MIIQRFSLSFALCLAGCGSITDVSNHERYRHVIGKSVAVRRPMLLINHADGIFSGTQNDVLSLRPVRYGLADLRVHPSPTVHAVLPEGHLITIERIQDEAVVDSWLTVIYGRTLFPKTGKTVTFAYARAPLKYTSHLPLPWED